MRNTSLYVIPFLSSSPLHHTLCFDPYGHHQELKLHWLRHYAISRNVEGSIPDEVIEFSQFASSFQPHYVPGVDSASGVNKYQVPSWGKARL
jgi:hypothetical protein